MTVTKKTEFDWSVVKPSVELVLSQFFDAGIPVVRPGAVQSNEPKEPSTAENESIESKIMSLIEERVRPFVQQDGGDLEFVSFDRESGLVQLRMQGSCRGCPKSAVTLKMGIERMLKYYIPEITSVINIDDGAQEKVELSDVDRDKAKEFGP